VDNWSPTSHHYRRSRSSDSVGSSEFSLTDTGDIAEQLADQEDPLRIHLGYDLDNELFTGIGRAPRKNKRVRLKTSNRHRNSGTQAKVINKEAIEIPDAVLRRPSIVERLFGANMAMGSSSFYGLTGRPLMLVHPRSHWRHETDENGRSYFTTMFVSLGVFLFGYDQGVMSGLITYVALEAHCLILT
jgi:hypothetical protein